MLRQYNNIFIKDYTDLNDDIHEQPCLTKTKPEERERESKGIKEKTMLNTASIIDGAKVERFHDSVIRRTKRDLTNQKLVFCELFGVYKNADFYSNWSILFHKSA